jgi:hypothetical protein
MGTIAGPARVLRIASSTGRRGGEAARNLIGFAGDDLRLALRARELPTLPRAEKSPAEMAGPFASSLEFYGRGLTTVTSYPMLPIAAIRASNPCALKTSGDKVAALGSGADSVSGLAGAVSRSEFMILCLLAT